MLVFATLFDAAKLFARFFFALIFFGFLFHLFIVLNAFCMAFAFVERVATLDQELQL